MDKILALRRRIAHRVAHRIAHGEHLLHCAYLGLVFVEGHGLYATVAGGGFALVLLHLALVGLGGELD